jgi:hypothetical protein
MERKMLKGIKQRAEHYALHKEVGEELLPQGTPRIA